MSQVITNSVVLGQSATDTNNFLLDTDTSGALRIRRKSDGSGGTVLTVNSSGIILDKDGNDMRPLGVGQTWQNVTGSRVAGTTYTNNTGRPIVVSAYANNASAGQASISITINGILAILNGSHSQSANASNPGISTVVPSGANYSITVSGNSPSITYWAELR